MAEKDQTKVDIYNTNTYPIEPSSKFGNEKTQKTSSFIAQQIVIELNPKETFSQIGIFLAAFSFALLADSLVFLKDSLDRKYSMEQFNSNNEGTFDLTEEEFENLLNIWAYLFGLTGILLGIVQFTFSAILATSSSKFVKNTCAGRVQTFVKLWFGTHVIILITAAVLVILGFIFQVYVPRVGVMLMAIFGVDAFFIFIGIAMIRVTLKEAKRDGIQVY